MSGGDVARSGDRKLVLASPTEPTASIADQILGFYEHSISSTNSPKYEMSFAQLRGRLGAAKLLLQQWLNQQPHSLPLGLLMADLHRRSGALEAARRELEQLLRLHPSNQELLQLTVLVDLQDGRGQNALQRLKAQFAQRPEGQRLELGLLLADLQRQLDQSKAAAVLYQQLAKESAEDIRALIALAMLHQEQGDAAEVERWHTTMGTALSAHA